MFKKDFPVAIESLQAVLDKTVKGENVTTLWLPKMSRTEFATKLQDQVLINQLTDGKYKDCLAERIFIVVSLNLEVGYFLKQLDEELSYYSSQPTLRAKLRDILQHSKVVLIVDNFNFRDKELLQYLLTLLNISHGKLTFVFVALASDFQIEGLNLEDFGIFYEHIIHFCYLSRREFSNWLKANGRASQLPAAEVGKLYEFCGGSVGIAKTILNNYQNNLAWTVASEDVQQFLQSVWDRFVIRERKIIRALINGSSPPPYAKEIQYLKRHKLIIGDRVNGSWFNFLLARELEINLSYQDETIYWDDLNLSKLLTDRSNLILKQMLASKREVLREEIAKVIWGNNWQEQYSDWAIDQSVSRLRKELKLIGLPNIIIAVKKIGFRLATA